MNDNLSTIKGVAEKFGTGAKAISAWQQLIDISFLPEEMKAVYKKLLKERTKRLFI